MNDSINCRLVTLNEIGTQQSAPTQYTLDKAKLDETDRNAKTLYVKYKPANLKELTTKLPQLTANQQQ